jgi:hypothetical protein
VIQPWPSRPRWPRWAMIPYLFLADIQNTALAAFLIFYERVISPTYATVPRLWDISVLEDQAAAGAIMWVPGSFVFLVPVGWVIYQILSPSYARREEIAARSAASVTVRNFSEQAVDRAVSRSAAVGRISRFLLAILMAGGGLLAKVPAAWGHHGGVVQLTEKAGPFIVTVFTEPTPVRAGPAEISVMVQDGSNRRPVLDAEVTLHLRKRRSEEPQIVAKATRQNATNKLMYAADVELPAAGEWQLRVMVHRGAVSTQIAGELMAAPPRIALVSLSPYLALLSVGFGLFALHRQLRRRRAPHSRGARGLAG